MFFFDIYIEMNLLILLVVIIVIAILVGILYKYKLGGAPHRPSRVLINKLCSKTGFIYDDNEYFVIKHPDAKVLLELEGMFGLRVKVINRRLNENRFICCENLNDDNYDKYVEIINQKIKLYELYILNIENIKNLSIDSYFVITNNGINSYREIIQYDKLIRDNNSNTEILELLFEVKLYNDGRTEVDSYFKVNDDKYNQIEDYTVQKKNSKLQYR